MKIVLVWLLLAVAGSASLEQLRLRDAQLGEAIKRLASLFDRVKAGTIASGGKEPDSLYIRMLLLGIRDQSDIDVFVHVATKGKNRECVERIFNTERELYEALRVPIRFRMNLMDEMARLTVDLGVLHGRSAAYMLTKRANAERINRYKQRYDSLDWRIENVRGLAKEEAAVAGTVTIDPEVRERYLALESELGSIDNSKAVSGEMMDIITTLQTSGVPPIDIYQSLCRTGYKGRLQERRMAVLKGRELEDMMFKLSRRGMYIDKLIESLDPIDIIID